MNRKLNGPVIAMIGCASSWLVTGCTPEQTAKLQSLSIIKTERPPPAPDPRTVWPPRAVWVVREKYSSPAEIAALMENCKQAGLNTVLFQVRGNGTAYYRSSVEPFAYEYGGDPGFDPLEVACNEAHRRGLALQAWVNVMPAWQGLTPPSDPHQLYNAHPEWFWYDQNGKRQPLYKADHPREPWYVSVNPCLPEVRAYLVKVFEEIVRRYPVDGLHLDYIRFPTDESPKNSDYPYDSKTLLLYRQASGKKPQDDRARWSEWRTQQVTQVIREIRSMITRVRPGVRLTASCGSEYVLWRKNHFQDGPTWLRSNLVDLVFVMNYNKNTSVFKQRETAWMQTAPGRPVAPGIGIAYHEDDATTIEQLRLAQQWGYGFSMFSSRSLFSSSERSQRRLAAVRPALLAMQTRNPI